MADKTLVLKGFNDHFGEFISDVSAVFPDDSDILATKNALSTVRKANPRLIIDAWYKHIVVPYEDKINEGNLDFFLSKDYSNDIKTMNNNDKIMNKIDMLRKPISEMSDENRNKTMKYIQNLLKLAKLYFMA